MVAVVQVKQQRMNVRPEGSARRHAVGWLRLEALPAMAATAAEQLDPHGLAGQKRNIDAIIAMSAGLPLPRNIAAAMLAG